jgi:WhiB family transcriptional regulator, redox-sensing transcriptional regulator
MDGGRSGSAGSRRWNWRAAARCRTEDADGLFVVGARQREARQLCRGCAVRTECLAHALDHRIEFGMWGGMTERERRALLRNRPDVRSWADLLVEARDAHYASAADETAAQLAVVSEQAGAVEPAPGEPELDESA